MTQPLNTTSRTIQIRPYLESLAELPEITTRDVEQAAGVFEQIFPNAQPSSLFSRGLKSGDGKVLIARRYTSDTGEEITANFVLDERGGIKADVFDYSSALPAKLAPFFFAGIFGVDEMSQSGRQAPTGIAHVDPQFSQLVEGVRTLYDCIVEKGSKTQCMGSDVGAGLAAAKNNVEARKAALEQEATLNQRRATLSRVTSEFEAVNGRLTPEGQLELAIQIAPLDAQIPPSLDTIEAADQAIRIVVKKKEIAELVVQKARRASARENCVRQTEEFWRAAEAMREGAKGLFSSGDPDGIQEIMNRYISFRFPVAYTESFEVACGRSTKAQEMLRDIGRSDAGWPQFRQRFCSKYGGVVENCKVSGNSTVYQLACGFGVGSRGETVSESHSCVDEKEEKTTGFRDVSSYDKK